MKKLSQGERDQLQDALDDCHARDSGESWRNGSHFILLHLLRLLGASANSSESAERVAEDLLYGKG